MQFDPIRNAVLAIALSAAALVLMPWPSVAQQAAPGTSAPAAQFVPRTEAPEQYPAHPNRDDAFYGCTACHAFSIVAQQGMSRQRWDDSIDWMIERHKMPKPTAADREKILDYLSTAFPERQRGGGAGWRNPFAPK